MAALPDISAITGWIETHGKTVDIMKWLVLLLVAWGTGVFRFIHSKLRTPSATIDESTSRCLVEEFAEFQGHQKAVRATFLVEVGFLNPTSERLVVRHFSLAVQRRKVWRAWKPELVALSLPSRPRHQTGSGEKVLTNWFSKFQDDFHDLTLSGGVEPKELPSGFLLFVCFSVGNWAPRISDDHIKVKARVHLTTGETYSVSGRVKVVRDAAKFEQWVPGIVAHINHDSAWGSTR
jgi:hypothetical protein